MPEITARDAKLIQYLNEAYGKEKELETALQAHIAITTRAPYKKRLRQHLTETKGHSRAVERRIKQLGGKAETVNLPDAAPDAVGGAAATLQSVASKAVAAAKGPLHALRGTGENEKMLKNAKTEYFNEAEEIATYTSIETLADTVGDRETAKLARSIRREEERMSSFLERLIPALTKSVAQEEIPAAERRAKTKRRGSTSAGRGARSRRNGSSTRASSSRSSAATGRSRSSTKSASSSRSSGGSSRKK